MSDVVRLDAGPLGMISHPRATAEIVTWLARLVAARVEVLIPEIADYEVRRELLRVGSTRGIGWNKVAVQSLRSVNRSEISKSQFR